jgi:NAD(P)-dependent dehydrogenase (short-subunit alcohol dehydrogenase family)
MTSVVITGASRGIGRATALLAGERGWSVLVNYREQAEAAEETAEEVQRKGGEAITFKADATHEEEVAAMFDAAVFAFGGVDAVVVNAGIVAPASLFADMDSDRLRRVVEVNVLGSYLTAREAARRLSRDRGGKGGSMVIVSSMAARLGSPFEYVDYAGSKAALDALTIGLARELGPQGVRVNAVRPGLIDTDIHASGGRPDRAHELGVTTPLGRAGTAAEVAEAIIWLLSDAAPIPPERSWTWQEDAEFPANAAFPRSGLFLQASGQMLQRRLVGLDPGRRDQSCDCHVAADRQHQIDYGPIADMPTESGERFVAGR